MLRVTVVLVPDGGEERAQTIARMTISNISNLAEVSDYEFRAHEQANPVAGTPPRETTGTVRHHDRRQTVWRLIGKAALGAAGD
jgi:hypothetical protein